MKKLSVVIVNFNGFRYLKTCFDALRDQTYKNLEIIMVDNGSKDESLDFVSKNYPEVKLVKLDKNTGFTGGNNAGFKVATGDIIVMLNNDTRVEPEWAEEIVKAFDNPQVGITTSKLTFFTKFIPIELHTQISNLKDLRKDPRDLGLRISKLEFEGVSYKKSIYKYGFYQEEKDKKDNYFNWISEKALAYLPVQDITKHQTLLLALKGNKIIKNQTLKILINDEVVIEINIDNSKDFKDYRVEVPQEILHKNAVYIINNVGTFINTSNGWTMDLGINEVDEGQYEEEKEVPSACGCSMAIRKEVMDQIGGLNDSFFAYFEDTEYSWHASKKGWKIKYVPKSVVRHIHTGTSKSGSNVFNYLVERNRLLCLIYQGSLKNIIKEIIKYKISTVILIPKIIFSIIYPPRRALLKERLTKFSKRIKILIFITVHLPGVFLKRM